MEHVTAAQREVMATFELPTLMSRELARERIAQDVEAFVAGGGQIQQVARGVLGYSTPTFSKVATRFNKSGRL